MKPLAIDLFCGLGLAEAEFCLSADSTVEQLEGRARRRLRWRLRLG